MTQSVLSVRMDAATKEAFALFCEQAGMSVSAAVNVFAKQTIRDQRIPFVISLNNEQLSLPDEERAYPADEQEL